MLFLFCLGIGITDASLITTTTSGDLMFEYLGGEAGPSLQEFGLGTPNINSALSQRNMIFQIDYRNATVTPSVTVNKGYFVSGSQLSFYNLSDYNGNLYAFSSSLSGSPSSSDLSVFSDTNNSLGLGGSIVENIGFNNWVLHMDDAWSYMYDDDDNEMLIRVWVDQSASPPATPVPEPATMLLFGSGFAALAGIRIRSKKMRECRSQSRMASYIGSPGFTESSPGFAEP